jgi:hypothetical protein
MDNDAATNGGLLGCVPCSSSITGVTKCVASVSATLGIAGDIASSGLVCASNYEKLGRSCVKCGTDISGCTVEYT